MAASLGYIKRAPLAYNQLILPGERRRILEVHAIEFHGVGALLDLSIYRSYVLAHDAEENKLERRDKKHPDQHWGETKGHGGPEQELKNEIAQGNEERKGGTDESGKSR